MSGDHPIRIEPFAGRVVVRLDGRTLADTTRALKLHEASYPPVTYLPRSDVDMATLRRSDHSTLCPFKGDATYFDIDVADRRIENAVWSYERPRAGVADIEGHLAFYPTQVEIISQEA